MSADRRPVPPTTAASAQGSPTAGAGAAPSLAAPGAAALPPAPERPGPLGWLALLAWVFGSIAIGGAVGWFTRPDAWFESLAKPTWQPPDWLFGPVWTLLYALIGAAAWLFARTPGGPPGERRAAWVAFALQAGLNLAWSPLFFRLHSPGLAFLDICLLWLAVLATTLLFGRVRPLAGYLLWPYVLWVSFALVLNGTIWLMN
ncbi:TspO/MBR family protein [Arenimonas composti]|uniref:Tryptophan-rich sensory protein n=1 Tax=Arenimonas composti TR7-09 = DSM 18010 TaxID=1121013 RepID=A0A091BF87_9GAMM|nr:TspO/MBR family protein [Arenimonas composti]KFN49439.1 hypothetical protein P873_10725 [Arenimonas composti TR7-09 = DSM 18010]